MEICIQSGGIIEHVDMEKGYTWMAKAGFTAIDWTAIEHGLKVWIDGYAEPRRHLLMAVIVRQNNA